MSLEKLGRAMKPVPEPEDSDECLSFSSDEEFEGSTGIRSIPASSVLNRPSIAVTAPSISPNTYFRTTFGDKGEAPIQASKPLSFDAFLEVISSEVKTIPESTHPSNPCQKPSVYTPDKSALRLAKELALRKEQRQNERKVAVTNLQNWWRRVRCIAAIKRTLFFVRLTRGICVQARRNCLKSIASAMKEAQLDKIRKTQLILMRYRETCAVTIQRFWRNRRESRMKLVEKQRENLLLAYVQGWKTRRIFHSWPICDILHRFSSSIPSERPFLVTELVQTFQSEYRGGRWMRQKRVENRSRARRKVSEITTTSTSPVRITAVGMHSPRVCTQTSTPSAKSTTERPRQSEKTFPVKPFLKRKTQAIAMQKVNWTGVKTKVNCWGVSDALGRSRSPKESGVQPFERNSVEEFVAIEQMSRRKTEGSRTSKVGNRSNSLPQKTGTREKDSAGKEKGQQIVRLATIKSAEDSDEGDFNMFSTFDSLSTRQVRLKRQKSGKNSVNERTSSVDAKL